MNETKHSILTKRKKRSIMKTIKNANLAKLLGIISKRDNCYGVVGATVAHLTNIKLSDVDTIEYEPSELKDVNPDDNTVYFFVSKDVMT